MVASISGKRPKTPVILTRKDEEILKAVNFYRYMTARDVARLLFSPAGLVRVRSALTALCGGDFVDDEYLYRLRLPNVPGRNPERIYTLGAKGRDYLTGVLGMSVNWHFQPKRIKHFGFNVVMHNLVLTRVLVAARWWAEAASDFRVSQVRICYELGQTPAAVEIDVKGKMEKVSVIPDGWIMFERLRGGVHEHWFPVLLEIDRGTMYRERCKKHVRSRIEFVESGEYERVFGTKAVVVAYATTGASGELAEGRRRALCEWTIEVLKESSRESWARVFRFASVSFGDLYERPLFDAPVWYRPDQESPVGVVWGVGWILSVERYAKEFPAVILFGVKGKETRVSSFARLKCTKSLLRPCKIHLPFLISSAKEGKQAFPKTILDMEGSGMKIRR